MRWHKLPNGSLVDLEHVIAVDKSEYQGEWIVNMQNGTMVITGVNFDVDEFLQVLTRYRSTQNVHRTT